MGRLNLYSFDGAIATDSGTADTANSRAAAITANATAHVKGAWVQLIAATARPTTKIIAQLQGGTTNVTYLVDVGIGPDPNQIVWIPNLLHDGNSDNQCVHDYDLPLQIPSGLAVWVRCSASTGGAAMRAQVHISYGGLLGQPASSFIEALGITENPIDSAHIAAQDMDIGQGAWSTIGTPTRTWRGFLVAFSSRSLAPSGSAEPSIDIGIGSTPDVIFENYHMGASGPFFFCNPSPFISMRIPAGQPLKARMEWSTASTSNVYGAAIYGVPA